MNRAELLRTLAALEAAYHDAPTYSSEDFVVTKEACGDDLDAFVTEHIEEIREAGK